MRIYAFLFLLSFNAFADFKLNDLTSAELSKISQDFSANFMFTSVNPAHGNGNLFGLEIGLVANVTESDRTEKVVQRVDSTQSLSNIASAYGLVTLTIPFGFTFELGLVPETDIGDGKVKYTAGAVKWSKNIFALLDMAVRAHYSMGDFSFSQTISAVTTKVEIENKVMGMDLIASADLFVLEPYIGFGFVKGETSVNATGSVIFNSTEFTSSPRTVTVDDSSVRMFAGVQLDLFLMRLAAEYARMFETNRISAKLSFYF